MALRCDNMLVECIVTQLGRDFPTKRAPIVPSKGNSRRGQLENEAAKLNGGMKSAKHVHLRGAKLVPSDMVSEFGGETTKGIRPGSLDGQI